MFKEIGITTNTTLQQVTFESLYMLNNDTFRSILFKFILYFYLMMHKSNDLKIIINKFQKHQD